MAKKVIHTLNKESVEGMVKILQLNGTDMSPEALVNLIKTKRTDGSLNDQTELKIKEIVYFKKLYAIKSLVLLLHMDRTEMNLPEEAPGDLIDVIFTPEFGIFLEDHPEPIQMDKKPVKMHDEDFSGDFFCMSCFHEAYTKWKRENNIEP